MMNKKEEKSKIFYFASSNKDKLKEIKNILKLYKVKRLKILLAPEGFSVNENGKTYLENAYKKASTLSKSLKCFSIADDSGLEVKALNGHPGIKSARYYGRGKGIYKILEKIKNKKNRKCSFKCGIVITNPKGKIIFKTLKSWTGEIAKEPKGKYGFGYDPIFYIPELKKTAAEIPRNVKDKISHRGMAIKFFVDWVKTYD